MTRCWWRTSCGLRRGEPLNDAELNKRVANETWERFKKSAHPYSTRPCMPLMKSMRQEIDTLRVIPLTVSVRGCTLLTAYLWVGQVQYFHFSKGKFDTVCGGHKRGSVVESVECRAKLHMGDSLR